MRSPLDIASVSLALYALTSVATVQRGSGQDTAQQDRAPDLSPQAAARSGSRVEADTPKPDLRLPSDERGLSERVPGLIRAASATAGEKVVRAFDEATWRLLRPWQRALSLQKVYYWYVGRTIDAVIHQDGSIEIRNKEGTGLSPVAYQTLQGSQPGTSEPGSKAFGSPTGVGVGIGVVDPARAFNRMVKKPSDNVEVRRLLSETLALRDRLVARATHKSDRRAITRLSSELNKLWQAPGSLNEKQERTFALWDQCAEDETGAEGRTQIEAFLHRLQATQGRCPYDPERIAALNAARTGKRPFAPCAELMDAGSDH